MNFLFVGSVIPGELSLKRKGCSVAGNKMQLGIIQSLSKLPDCNVQALSTYPIASFPKEKIIGIRKSIYLLSSGERIYSVPFINVFILKQITQVIGLFIGLNCLKKNWENKNCIILCFNSYPEWSFPVLLFSRINRIPKICMLADLPIHVNNYRNVKELASRIHTYLTISALKKFDALVTLNKVAQIRFAPNLPYCNIDGGININEYPRPTTFGGFVDKGERIISFTGSLVEYNGIVNLIRAIKKIKEKRLKFIFYGAGPLSQLIVNVSISDSRIHYGGSVSNTEILAIQRNSSFLINPRPTRDLLSQVTFPSKILEYMMSGTPILTTRLNGLVNDYQECLFFIDDEPEMMALDIEKALLIEREILVSRSKLAYEFVKENKNWDKHAKTIYNFSKKLFSA